MTVQDVIKVIRDDQRSAVLGQMGDITPEELKQKLIKDVRVSVPGFWMNDYFLPTPEEKQLIENINEAIRLYGNYLRDGKPSLAH